MLEVVGMNLKCHHGRVDGYQVVIRVWLPYEVSLEFGVISASCMLILLGLDLEIAMLSIETRATNRVTEATRMFTAPGV